MHLWLHVPESASASELVVPPPPPPLALDLYYLLLLTPRCSLPLLRSSCGRVTPPTVRPVHFMSLLRKCTARTCRHGTTSLIYIL